MAGQIKVGEIAVNAIVYFLMYWIPGPLPIGVVLLRRCGDKRDGLLPTRYVLVNVPFVIRVRVLGPGDGVERCPVGWCVPNCRRCFIKRTLGAPCLDAVMLALRRCALVGRGMLRRGRLWIESVRYYCLSVAC